MPVAADLIWRDYVTDGVPSTGRHKPDKSEIREWGTWVEAGINNISYDETNNVLRLGDNIWPDREPGAGILTATGVVAVGGGILIGSNINATVSTFIGYRTAENANNLYGCDFIGFRTGDSVTDGQYLTLIGIDAGNSLTTAANTVIIGPHAANWKTEVQNSVILAGAYAEGTVSNSIIIGGGACDNNQVAGTAKTIESSVVVGVQAARFMSYAGAAGNTVIGYQAASLAILVGGQNTIIGRATAAALTSGTLNTLIGDGAGATISTAHQSTAIGRGADTGNFSNSTAIGDTAAGTASNQITLGNASIATLRCQVTSITALSDARDKKHIEDLSLGIEFIRDVKVRSFVWAMRDGAKVGIRQAGIIAQELLELQQKHKASWMGLVDETNPDRLEATEGKLLFPLIRAVQEVDGIVADLRKSLDEGMQVANDNHKALTERVDGHDQKIAALEQEIAELKAAA